MNAAGSSYYQAEVAQLVEHDLAKVGVAGSSLVFRSKKIPSQWFGIFYLHPSGMFTTGKLVDALVAELVDAQDLKSCLP